MTMIILCQLILSQAPDIRDVFYLLRDIFSHWNNIGRELGISFHNYRKELQRQDPTSTNESKLEQVLLMWMEL